MGIVAKGWGKGSKVCKSCREVCNSCSKTCPFCEAPFTAKKKQIALQAPEIQAGEKRVLQIPVEYSEYTIHHTVSAPAGPAEYRLKENATKEDLENWCHKTRLFYLKSHQFLRNEALLYLLRKQYDWQSEEYLRLKEMMREIPDSCVVTRRCD